MPHLSALLSIIIISGYFGKPLKRMEHNLQTTLYYNNQLRRLAGCPISIIQSSCTMIAGPIGSWLPHVRFSSAMEFKLVVNWTLNVNKPLVISLRPQAVIAFVINVVSSSSRVSDVTADTAVYAWFLSWRICWKLFFSSRNVVTLRYST